MAVVSKKSVLVLTLAVLVLATISLWFWSTHSDRAPFDSVAWKVGEQLAGDRGVRLRMLDDLLRRHKLAGLSRAEVDDLLGPPTETGYFKEYDRVYWLDPERGFLSIDSEWLALKFEQDRVVAARIVRD